MRGLVEQLNRRVLAGKLCWGHATMWQSSSRVAPALLQTLHPPLPAPLVATFPDPAQLSDALQRGIITQADLHLRQQVAAVVVAGGHPGVLLSSAAEAAAVAAGSPSLYDGEPQLSAATQSAPGSPDLASLLFDCVCLEGDSPTSVLPSVAAATAAGKAAAW